MKKKWLRSGAAILFIYGLARMFRLVLTSGISMEPTIKSGQVVLLDRTAYWRRNPRIGELVIFKPGKKGLAKHFLKRVVGREGDKVKLRFGVLYLNGKRVKEPYLAADFANGRFMEWTVPSGHIFVLGDNRNHSLDSRKLGPIPLKNVVGVVKGV